MFVVNNYIGFGSNQAAYLKDPYWSSVVTLLHLDGANNGTTFTDSTGLHTYSATGQAVTSTAQSVFGGSSLYTDGTGDWISSGDSTDWDLIQGDFTIEWRVRWAGTPGPTGFMGQSNGGGATNKWGIYWNVTEVSGAGNTNRLAVHYTGNQTQNLCTWTPSGDTWYAVAIVRSGNTWYSFIDGTQTGTLTAAISPATSSSTFRVGADGENFRLLNGYIDELRITKGVARYTGASYTLATQEFPNR